MIQKSNSTLIVDLSRIKANIETLSSFVHENTRIMAVVKSDAYGHGAVEVAKAIQPQIGAFAVNDIEEGIELRKNNITKPILVFAVPEKYFVSQYRVHNLTATVSSREHFEWLPHGTSYHLNFDTGMGRLGLRPEEAEEVAALAAEHTEIFCTGIYTHLATADTPNSERVLRQYEEFKKIRSYFPDKLNSHIANTGALAFYDAKQFNIVRLGIGIYGYPPGERKIKGIRPTLYWKSRMVQTNSIEADNKVSYGANWKAPHDGYIGVIPVGYDDGLKRSLSHKLTVSIAGKMYDIVGTITMNYCMVFLKRDYYKPGTEVKLLFEGNNAVDCAHKIDTIPYEILTSINPKIPRSYKS